MSDFIRLCPKLLNRSWKREILMPMRVAIAKGLQKSDWSEYGHLPQQISTLTELKWRKSIELQMKKISAEIR